MLKGSLRTAQPAVTYVAGAPEVWSWLAPSAPSSLPLPLRGAAHPTPPHPSNRHSGDAMAAAPFQWSLAALETLMAEDQMDQHAAVLRAFSVVELWRLRRVCRAF